MLKYFTWNPYRTAPENIKRYARRTYPDSFLTLEIWRSIVGKNAKTTDKTVLSNYKSLATACDRLTKEGFLEKIKRGRFIMKPGAV